MAKNSYGKRHQEAREEKFRELGGEKVCEVTGSTKNIECHHSTPKLFNGDDHPSNYIALNSYIHQKVLHDAANVNNPKLVGERIHLTRSLMKHLLDEDKSKLIHAQIKEVDSTLITKYVENMLDNIAHKYRDAILRCTIIAGMNSTRDLSIENERYRRQLEILQKENAQIKNDNEMLRKQLGYI